MTVKKRTGRVMAGLIGLVAALLIPSAAQAYNEYPDDWFGSTQPGWFSETLGGDGLTHTPSGNILPCVPGRYQAPTGTRYLVWSFEGNPDVDQVYGEECERQWGEWDSSQGFGTASTDCEGVIYRELVTPPAFDPQNTTLGNLYKAEWTCTARQKSTSCDVVICRKAGTYCTRKLTIGDWFDLNTGMWDSHIGGPWYYVDDTGWEPNDCRAELPGWPDTPTDVLIERCHRASQKLERAERKLERANTPAKKRHARKQVHRAKQRVRAVPGCKLR